MTTQPHHYDADGRPISPDEWTVLFERPGYRRIAEDCVGGVRISTVWLGLDLNPSRGGPPLIFETMADPFHQDENWRWPTKQEAIEGHRRVCRSYRRRRNLHSSVWLLALVLFALLMWVALRWLA